MCGDCYSFIINMIAIGNLHDWCQCKWKHLMRFFSSITQQWHFGGFQNGKYVLKCTFLKTKL